jgi:DNA (cytosine-5)-methyltransferase 1
VTPVGPATVYNIAVDQDESYVVDNAVVHNCQPFSSAGLRLGASDPRALWPWVAEMIRFTRPTYLFGENVARIRLHGELRRVVRTLAALGYVGSWWCLTAADVGAPHKRERLTLFAVRADAPHAHTVHDDGRGHLGT